MDNIRLEFRQKRVKMLLYCGVKEITMIGGRIARLESDPKNGHALKLLLANGMPQAAGLRNAAENHDSMAAFKEFLCVIIGDQLGTADHKRRKQVGADQDRLLHFINSGLALPSQLPARKASARIVRCADRPAAAEGQNMPAPSLPTSPRWSDHRVPRL